MNVVSPSVYAAAMIANNLHPSAWSTVAAYKTYVKEFDLHVTPDEWLLITVASMERQAASRMATVKDFYRVTTPNEMMHLIRTKAVYPRYLVCDPLFNQYVSGMAPIVGKMLAETIEDQYTVKNAPCDDIILAVIEHVRSLG